MLACHVQHPSLDWMEDCFLRIALPFFFVVSLSSAGIMDSAWTTQGILNAWLFPKPSIFHCQGNPARFWMDADQHSWSNRVEGEHNLWEAVAKHDGASLTFSLNTLQPTSVFFFHTTFHLPCWQEFFLKPYDAVTVILSTWLVFCRKI